MVVNIGFPSEGVPNQGWKLYLASLVMILSAGVVVALRIFTRFRTAKLGPDDYAILTSLAFSVILSVNIQLAVVHGYGKHKRDLALEDLRTCLKFFWVAQTPYKIVVCLNKTSVIMLCRRIFISKTFNLLCYGTLAIVISSGIATTFATIFQCTPIRRSWDKTISGSCIDSARFWLSNAVLNISTDCLVLALPIREIFALRLELQERLMICGVFLLGGFVTITSILRVTAVANSAHNQQDQTWTFIPRGIWTLIEANLGIICSSLPVLKQLVKRLLPLNPSQDMFNEHEGSDPGLVRHFKLRLGLSSPANGEHRQHRLDVATDGLDTIVFIQSNMIGRETWSSTLGVSHLMESFSTRDSSDAGHKSDEMRMIDIRDESRRQDHKERDGRG